MHSTPKKTAGFKEIFKKNKPLDPLDLMVVQGKPFQASQIKTNIIFSVLCS